MLTKIDFHDSEIWVLITLGAALLALAIRYLLIYLPRKRSLKAVAMADMLDFRQIIGCTDALERFNIAYACHLRYGHLDLYRYHAAALNSLYRAVRYAESALADEKDPKLVVERKRTLELLKAKTKILEDTLKDNPLTNPDVKTSGPLVHSEA